MIMKKLSPTLMLLLATAVLLTGCTAAATTSSGVEPAVEEASNGPSTSTPDPLEMGVHTPEDVEDYFNQWPEEHKRRLSDDVVAVFTYPHPVANWVGGGIIYHIPSVSTVYLDFRGNVDEQLTHYESEEGQTRLEAILDDDELMQQLQAEVLGRWSEAQSMATPEPLDADEALMQDAALYAEGQGIPLEEAVIRLRLQETIGPLGATLEANEAETFAGLWLQHEPEFRLVLAFTENGEETARPYIEGQPYANYVELRTHPHTFAELVAAQEATMATAAELGLANNSWIDVITNRVIFETGNPDLFRQAIEENGQTIPEVVELIEIDPEALSPTLQGEVEIIEGVGGRPIYFPRQAPTNIHMDALLKGQLILDDKGCLRVEAEGSEGLLVIWHYEDMLRVTAEAIEVLNGDGQVIARVGEPISMGGGEGGAMIDIPGMPIDGCPGPYWIAGGIDPLDS